MRRSPFKSSDARSIVLISLHSKPSPSSLALQSANALHRSLLRLTIFPLHNCPRGTTPLAPLPGRDALGFGQRPQAALGLARFGFQAEKRLVSVVLPINPSGALADHLCIHIDLTSMHPSDGAPVAVGLLHIEAHVAPEGQFAQRLSSAGAVGLTGFGSVDFGEPHFDLALLSRPAGEGVAVADRCDATCERGGEGGERKSKEVKRRSWTWAASPSGWRGDGAKRLFVALNPSKI